jgi:hypothetical protein
MSAVSAAGLENQPYPLRDRLAPDGKMALHLRAGTPALQTVIFQETDIPPLQLKKPHPFCPGASAGRQVVCGGTISSFGWGRALRFTLPGMAWMCKQYINMNKNDQDRIPLIIKKYFKVNSCEYVVIYTNKGNFC